MLFFILLSKKLQLLESLSLKFDVLGMFSFALRLGFSFFFGNALQSFLFIMLLSFGSCLSRSKSCGSLLLKPSSLFLVLFGLLLFSFFFQHLLGCWCFISVVVRFLR